MTVPPEGEGTATAVEPEEPAVEEPQHEPPEEPSGEAEESAEPEPRSVAQSIKEARERVERGESIVPQEEEEEDGAEAEPEADEEAGAEEGEAVEPAEEDEDDDPDAEVADSAEEEEGEEAPEEEEPEAEFVAFELPSRHADGEPVPVEIPAELQEDFNRLRNGYMRGEQAREVLTRAESIRDEIAADKDEVEYIRRELGADPVGFLAEHVATEHRRDLLLNLLADDEVWEDEQLQDQLREWEHSPNAREHFRTKTKAERLEAQNERRTAQQQEQRAREGARQTGKLVLSLFPEDGEPARRDKFYRLAMNRLSDLAYETARTDFSRDEVVKFLDQEGILDGYGIDPAAAGQDDASEEEASVRRPRGADRSSGRRGGSRPPARARRVTAEEARGTGERLKEESKRRRSAAAYAPSGAGAPAASTELPKGQSVKERIAYVRKMGLARVMGDS
jgi:hypothetical protein